MHSNKRNNTQSLSGKSIRVNCMLMVQSKYSLSPNAIECKRTCMNIHTGVDKRHAGVDMQELTCRSRHAGVDMLQ